MILSLLVLLTLIGFITWGIISFYRTFHRKCPTCRGQMKYIGERVKPPNMQFKWVCPCGKEIIEEQYEDSLWIPDYNRVKDKWY